jgi:ATP-dependent DNA helicase RecQ
MHQPKDILKKYWGYDNFRPMQLDIIQSVLDGQDTLALLPTGGGKSVCFQVPALCKEGVCVVVSPLIALMKDQVYNLRERGISAYAIYSGMSIKDIDRILDLCVHGHAQFLYLSPERLGTEIARTRIEQMPVNLFAIDEAHCISQWGYDFRPSYLKIAEIRELKPEVPVIALTATATKEVVDDMQEKLEFKPNAEVFQKSFARDNLSYVVLKEENKMHKLLEILRKIKGSAVVYVLNRKSTKDIAEYLQQNHISASYYHAGLHHDKRAQIQEAWISNKVRVIVATNAFGMGIDKPDVRVVVHLSLPDNLEAYFQEAGRAGRDSAKAYAILLNNASDQERLAQNFKDAYPPLKEIRQVYRALGSYFQLAIGSGMGRSFDFDLLDFSNIYKIHPIKVLNALKILMQAEYLELSDAVYFPSTIQFLMDNKGLYDYMLKQPRTEKLIKLMLRSYQGAFNHDVNIRENKLAFAMKVGPSVIKTMLQKMHQQKILRYKPQKDMPSITFLTERLDADHIVLDQEQYKFLKERAKKRMEAAIHYVETIQCRSQLLLEYFDEKGVEPCGQCDVCLGRHEKQPSKEEFERIKDYIRGLLLKRSRRIHAVLEKFPSHMEAKVIFSIEHLMDNGNILRQEDQYLRWIGPKN